MSDGGWATIQTPESNHNLRPCIIRNDSFVNIWRVHGNAIMSKITFCVSARCVADDKLCVGWLVQRTQGALGDLYSLCCRDLTFWSGWMWEEKKRQVEKWIRRDKYQKEQQIMPGVSGWLWCCHYAEICIHSVQMLHTTPPLTLLPSIKWTMRHCAKTVC